MRTFNETIYCPLCLARGDHPNATIEKTPGGSATCGLCGMTTLLSSWKTSIPRGAPDPVQAAYDVGFRDALKAMTTDAACRAMWERQKEHVPAALVQATLDDPRVMRGVLDSIREELEAAVEVAKGGAPAGEG